MKILQVINKLQNRGAETFACQLSGHLEALGHEVVIVALFDGEANLPYKGRILCLNASENKRMLDLTAWKKLASIIKDFRPNVVQANAGDTLKYVIFSRKIFGWKASILFRNASEVGRYVNSKLQKYYNSYLYRHVDAVASVSAASKKDIIRLFPFLKERVEIIPIGLEKMSLGSTMELKPEGIRHIVHVGGFSFEKNHVALLRIFALVLEKDPTVHLHLVGDGPLRKDIELEINKKRLQKQVTLHGFVNNPLSFIAAADVLVLPSLIEGLPGVILEAMYCKTSCVAYNVGGISEILNNHTGYLIPKNEEVKFSQAILKSFEKQDSEKLEKAFQLVTKDYMNTSIALKFVNSYRKIVPNKD